MLHSHIVEWGTCKIVMLLSVGVEYIHLACTVFQILKLE